MGEVALWLVILGGMLVTYWTRASFIALIGEEALPAPVRRGLRFVAPSVLAALIVPQLLFTEGGLHLALGNNRLIAGTIAAMVAWRWKNTWLTISVGMALLWILNGA